MTCIRKTRVFCVLLLAFCNVLTYVETYDECYYDFNCGYSRFCCKRRYPEDNVCRYNCIGQSCDRNDDCATGETCCDSDGKCKSGDCEVIKGLGGWVVAVIVISTIVGVVIPAGLIYRCCCAAGAARGNVTIVQVCTCYYWNPVTVNPVTKGTIVLANQQHQRYPNQQGQAKYVQNFQPDPYQLPGTPFHQ